MTDRQMLEIAQKRREEKRGTQNTGVTAYTGESYRNTAGGSSSSNDARARMIARMSTNPERMMEEVRQRREAEAAAAKERDRLERMNPTERSLARGKAEEAARLERWAKLRGWRDYAEYEADQEKKRNRR